MPQYVVLAYDATDADALERRMKARTAHFEMINRLRAEGKVLCGLALVDDADKMIGSMVAVNFESRSELDKWLAVEPYVVQKVWEKIEVKNAKIGPSFMDLIKL